jgi:hypothetical protein
MTDSVTADMILECPCGHVWMVTWPLPMPLKKFAAALKKAECPKCKSSKEIKLLMGKRYEEAKAKLENES